MIFKAKRIEVYGGTFTEVHEHERLNACQILSQSPYVVLGAIHDSGQRYPPSECHPGTREDILSLALDWVDKPPDESESQIFWLSGPAGVGKTAIAQSLCQCLKELGRLGGDFFLSRSVVGHSDLHTLFPTLAYQLACAHPEFGVDLDGVFKADESILTKNMAVQLEQLIINPLKRVNKLDVPLILVIDGLDEAGGENGQTSLLQLLGSGFLSHRLPVKVFLTSRPEPWIESAFRDDPPLRSSQCHFLRQTSQTDNDIRIVLKSAFAEIQRTHELIKTRSERWPSIEVIDDLVDRASGQFIYIETILRYIKDPNGNPIDRLHWVMQTPSTGHRESVDPPFLVLDTLYKHVLSTSLNIDRTLAILGAVISYGTNVVDISAQPVNYNHITKPDSDFSVDRIERILDFRAGDGLLAIRTLQSLVDVPSLDGKRGVSFYHKSFQDFLLDRNRSGEYFVDMNQVHSKLMHGAFRLVRDFEQSTKMSERQEIQQDLIMIAPRWEKWWLRAAASDQDRMLAEVKAFDPIMFYKSYAWNIARKMEFSWRFKKDSSRVPIQAYDYCESDCEVWQYRTFGNIAESILWDTYGYHKSGSGVWERCGIGGHIAEFMLWDKIWCRTSGLSLERFRVAKTVFNKYFQRALDTSFGDVIAAQESATGAR